MDANETNTTNDYAKGYRDAIRDLIELRRDAIAAAYPPERESGFLSYFVVLFLVFVIARSLFVAFGDEPK